MPLGPQELIQYFTVKYWIVADIEDSNDPGDLPDQTPVNGYVIFTPNLDKNAPVVRYPTALDENDEPLGFTLAPMRRKIEIVNGKLSHNDTGYVKLEANSTWANPPEWSWHVEFELNTGRGKIQRSGFDIAAVPDTIVDLTAVSPVSGGTGQQIVQGPQGFSIDGISIVGSQFYASLNDPLNTQLGPVTIPAVVAATESAAAAEAARAAAVTAQGLAESARDAAAGSASDASSSASSAAGSASAASVSATDAEAARAAAQALVDAFDLDVISTATGAPGTPASVTVSGGPPGYGLTFTIPQGLQGEKGEKGDPGPPVAPDSITAAEIAADAITASELADGAVDTNAIADLAVTAAKIANDTITATQIAPNAIGSSELADGAVDTNAIADLAVTAAKIANDTITATQIATDAIGSAELAADAVDTAAIQNLAVTAAKIANTTITDAQISASAAIALTKLATGRVAGSKNGTATNITIWVGTEAQYNTATSNGTTEDANTLYFRSA